VAASRPPRGPKNSNAAVVTPAPNLINFEPTSIFDPFVASLRTQRDFDSLNKATACRSLYESRSDVIAKIEYFRLS
jgi:hypothetical protein